VVGIEGSRRPVSSECSGSYPGTLDWAQAPVDAESRLDTVSRSLAANYHVGDADICREDVRVRLYRTPSLPLDSSWHSYGCLALPITPLFRVAARHNLVPLLLVVATLDHRYGRELANGLALAAVRLGSLPRLAGLLGLCQPILALVHHPRKPGSVRCKRLLSAAVL
jgi:hypothetical protein